MPGPATRLARDVAARTRSLPQTVVKSAAKEVADTLRIEAVRDTGDGRLSNLGGAKLTATTKLEGSSAVAVARVVPAPKSRGAWAIVERGTKRHAIPARRRRDNDALDVGGVGWRSGPVIVRGARAKHTWTNGVRAGTPNARRAADDEFHKVMS